MTIEEKLKQLILARYRSIREFTQIIDMPYSTCATIFSNGVNNANVKTIIKICKALGISADALADGRISYVTNDDQTEEIDLDHVISDVKGKVLNIENLTFRGKPVDRAGRLLIADYLDVSLELASRQINGERLRKYAEKISKKQ